jgi:hypothetical protein
MDPIQSSTIVKKRRNARGGIGNLYPAINPRRNGTERWHTTRRSAKVNHAKVGGKAPSVPIGPMATRSTTSGKEPIGSTAKPKKKKAKAASKFIHSSMCWNLTWYRYCTT